MIDQTIPLDRLTEGMARCVREWILPHLSDSMARIQAEQLIALLESLPRVVAPDALGSIREDSLEARTLLEQLGAPSAVPEPGDGSLEALMRENAALKLGMEQLAASLRKRPEAQAATDLAELQRFFVRSIQREISQAGSAEDFQKLTARDKAGKQ